jgi:hypothetical protein
VAARLQRPDEWNIKTMKMWAARSVSIRAALFLVSRSRRRRAMIAGPTNFCYTLGAPAR